MPTKLISVLTPCYNEEANVRELYQRIKAVFDALPAYRYEHIFIDNASKDGTVAVLRELAAADPNVKVIVNARNFGHLRSPHHGLLQASGEAVIALAADLQDPPELIPAFIQHWESGRKVVMGVKESSEESLLMYWVRGVYYRLLSRIADIQVVRHATGFGLYDRVVIEQLRKLDDPYPYFRGLMAELGTTQQRWRTASRSGSGGSRATTSIPYTTWRCWGSSITRRCRCASRRCSGSGWRR